MSTLLALVLGPVAIITTVPQVTFIISFAAALKKASLPMSIPAIVALPLGVLVLVSMVGLSFLHLRDCAHVGDRTIEMRRKLHELLIEVVGLFCILFAAVSLATFVWMQIRSADLPTTILGVISQVLLITAFVLWIVSSSAQASFLLVALLVSRGAAQQTESLHTDEEPHRSSEMQQTSSPQTGSHPSRGRASSDVLPLSSKSRKRSGSDAMNSIRSSITQVVRPVSSKTRLVSQKQSYRPTSLDSGTGERAIVENSFDSWDTSAVDPHARRFVMSTANSNSASSPNLIHFLETIPASPTGSRSPSPGFPLDLEPYSCSKRSQNHSPISTITDPSRRDLATTGNEAYIYPLFQTDGPTPPPPATPRTNVTAAPSASQVVLDRDSLCHTRSYSLPNNPSTFGYSRSKDVESDGENARSPSPVERAMTPPIPDWILGAGPRRGLAYAERPGLGPVRDVRDNSKFSHRTILVPTLNNDDIG